ncbi:hypothetical protein K523DRAFT_422213 [Schizophyllum commune Tattone D]|nr:hypothetical protein K523DRAFT_422213 [Schizophyllum commune Tattone D]
MARRSPSPARYRPHAELAVNAIWRCGLSSRVDTRYCDPPSPSLPLFDIAKGWVAGVGGNREGSGAGGQGGVPSASPQGVRVRAFAALSFAQAYDRAARGGEGVPRSAAGARAVDDEEEPAEE